MGTARNFSQSTEQLVRLPSEIIEFVLQLETSPATKEEIRVNADTFLESLSGDLLLLMDQLRSDGYGGESQWLEVIVTQLDDLRTRSSEHSNPIHVLDMGLAEIKTQLMLMFNRLQSGQPLASSASRAV